MQTVPTPTLNGPTQCKLFLLPHSAILFNKHTYGQFKPEKFFVSLIILWAKHELTSKAASKSGFCDYCRSDLQWIVLRKLKPTKLRTLFQETPTTAKRSRYRPCELFSVRLPFRLGGWQQRSQYQ